MNASIQALIGRPNQSSEENKDNEESKAQDKLQKSKDGKKEEDSEMQDESFHSANEGAKSDDNNLFGQIYEAFTNQSIKSLEDERKSIFQYMDNLSSELKTHKQKIQLQQKKLIKLQEDKKDTKKQEELVKKQTNVCLVQNQKKVEEAFNKVVSSNKEYFGHITQTGEQIEEKIINDYPNFNNKFVTDAELDKKVLNQQIYHHLIREGYKDTCDQFAAESKDQKLNNTDESLGSYQDQFTVLNEIVKDLQNHLTESAFKWASQNCTIIDQQDGKNFLFNLHKANYRKLLNKAVDIHFQINYQDKVLDNGISQKEPHGNDGDSPMANQSKEEKDGDQINSKSAPANQNYSQDEYDSACMKILRYVQQNKQYLNQVGATQQSDSSSSGKDQQPSQLQEQMIGAIAYIPEYSRQIYLSKSTTPKQIQKQHSMTIQVDQLDNSSSINSENNSNQNGDVSASIKKDEGKESPDKSSTSKDEVGKAQVDLPYFNLFDRVTMQELWETLVNDINQIYCEVHHISQSNPLFMTMVAQSYSMPSYLTAQKNLVSMEKGKRKNNTQLMSGFNSKEMACEVNLGDDFTYHNIFICPVSKETCNPQNGNWPMLLKCGHVISKVSLTKMTRGNSKQNFKCPTCPQEMTQENGVDQIVL